MYTGDIHVKLWAFFFFFLKGKLFFIAVEHDFRDLISWKCNYCFPGFVLSDFVSCLASLILPEPNNWLSLFNSLLALLCPCTQNLNLPGLSSYSIHTSAHPSLSVAASSHFSDTAEDGFKKHSRSADEMDCRALYEEPGPIEFSDDESICAQSTFMPLNSDIAETCASTPANRPTTRSRKLKCKSTNNTQLIS